MKRLLIASTLPVLALLAACGGGGNEIITTNDNNVVLNDAHSNFAFSNEGETPANDAGAMSADTANGSMSNDMSGGGTTTNAM